MRFALTMDHAKALAHLGKFLYYAGRLDEAERVFAARAGTERTLQTTRPSRSCRHISGRLAASAIAFIPSVLPGGPAESFDGDHAYWTGGVHALLGEKEPALAWLRRAVELGNHNYLFFRRDRNYERLRGDAEYEAMLAGVQHEWERYRQLFGSA